MRRDNFNYIFIGLISCLPLAIGGVGAAENDESYDALLIYGSGGIATWTQNFNESLRNELGPDLGQNFTPEFLSLISTSADDQELIARSLALKYSNRDIDLLVSMLPQANTFVMNFKHLFAPDAAVLHVLPGADISIESGPESDQAILASAIDIATANTIELVSHLFPQIEQLYVVGGAGPGDENYLARYRQVVAEMDTELRFHFLTGLPPDELIAELSSVPRNSGVVMTTYDIDNTGQLLQSHRITEQLVSNLELPVFGMTDTHLPVGAVGGNITTTTAYARSARAMIANIMRGEIPNQPVSAGTEYMFNGQQLDRFNIRRNQLPPGSIIINDTSNLWRDYPGWIAIGIGIILVQLILITLMIEARRRSRLAEEALRQTHKMEALGTLAGGIAHDFNNILMSIMANTELTSQHVKGNTPAEGRLGQILSACERAKNLVTQILMFSRRSTDIEWVPINVDEMLQEFSDHVRAFLPDSCHLELHCEQDLPRVLGDATQLHQIVMNLCVNAQHAMGNIGRIKVSAQSVQVTEQINARVQIIPAGNYVCISVGDNGVGIAEENLRHVFEPFFTTKPQGKGTGLGLSLVYQIVKSHSGFIDVDSDFGEGTTVRVYLPLAADQSSEIPVREENALSRGNQEHILLVDDDQMVLDANALMLSNLGYSVTAFPSSVEALQAFIRNPDQFDLLLSDLSMPEMDGVRLVNSVREYRPDMPAIICSGYADSLSPAGLEKVPVIEKPCTAAELAEGIRRALQGGNTPD